MKKTILASVLTLASTQTFAAQLKTCIDTVSSKCGTFAALASTYSVSGNQCTIVNAGQREDGTQYAKKVIFKDSNTVMSVKLDNCTSNRADILGSFKEQKQVLGRLFSLTEDGRVIVIGRDNRIVQLINSKHRPYTSIKDIKIEDNDGISLTFENGQSTLLDRMEILEKLNHPAANL